MIDKKSNLVVCVLLSVLLAQQRAYGQSYNYWNRVNTCELGQYPACSFDQSSTTNWQWWTTSSGMPTDTTTSPQTTSRQATQQCLECSRGFSSLNGVSTYNTWYIKNFYSCQMCQPGTYANRTGADLCDQCPSGYSCVDPARDPQPCPAGFYCTLIMTNSYNNYYNYNNYYYNDIGAPKVCPAGTYSKAGASECSACPAGYDCSNPTNMTKCPIGTATDVPNSCWSWPNLRCKMCPDGWYASKEGSITCTRCPEGYVCPDPTKIIKCPAGTFSSWSSSYMSTGTTNMNADTCTECPAGQYQNAEGQRSCKTCPKGSYCPVPQIGPIKCPTGTFSQEGQQACYPCPDGTYANTTGNSKCNKCPKGYYCNDPNIGPQLCPAGFYSNAALGQVNCSPCPSDTYADKAGSSSCTNCPDGMCCDDPSSPPTQCDTSDYSTQPTSGYTTGSWTWSS